ncbi:MAG TPA: hypothetical protein VGR78_14150, partial [Verrucomicrobiae bacterium]|nr:hypothetical protein [Verrucomicrobiae bacterium]
FNPPVILTNSTDALPPRKAIFFDDRKGVLLVRATLADLSKVESALQSLNSAPPQITIETRVIEDFEEDAARAVELVLRSAEVNTLKAPATNKSIVTVSDLLKYPNLRVVMDESDNRSLAEIRGSFEHASGAGSGILTEPEFRVIIRAFEQRKGIDILMPLRLTTASGHSAHVSDEDPSFVGRRYGITVTPIVETNGMTMYLSAEFDGSGLRNEPDFKAKGTVRLVDGQTLVLWPAVSRNKPRPVVFITPRIVGPAGNRVHTPDFPEMNTIPAQN